VRLALVLSVLGAAPTHRGAQLRDAGGDVPVVGADVALDIAADALPDAAPDAAGPTDVVSSDGEPDVVPQDVSGLDAPDGTDVAPDDAAADVGMDALVANDAALDVAPSEGGPDALADDVPIFTDAGCGARYESFVPDPGIHYPDDAGLTWSTNPPSSGPHYDVWGVWGVHTTPLPRGNYVHNLEHGGVVVLYRCDGDCTALRTQLTDLVNGLDPEPMCVALGMGVPRRIVLTEDPLIDAPVAAASWGWTYHANCFDAPSLTAFILARTGHATEDTCYQGYVP
jgi:hypothetical protein